MFAVVAGVASAGLLKRLFYANPGRGGFQPYSGQIPCETADSTDCTAGAARLAAVVRNLTAGLNRDEFVVFAPLDTLSLAVHVHPDVFDASAHYAHLYQTTALILPNHLILADSYIQTLPLAADILAHIAPPVLVSNLVIAPALPLSLSAHGVSTHASPSGFVTHVLACFPSNLSSVVSATSVAETVRSFKRQADDNRTATVMMALQWTDAHAAEWLALAATGMVDVMVLIDVVGLTQRSTSAPASGEVRRLSVAADGAVREVVIVRPPVTANALSIDFVSGGARGWAVGPVVVTGAEEIPTELRDVEYDADVAFLQQGVAVVNARLNLPVAVSAVAVDATPAGSWVEDAPLPELVMRALVEFQPDAELAMVDANMGISQRGGWPRGRIRLRHLHQTLWRHDEVCRMRIRGVDLWRLANDSVGGIGVPLDLATGLTGTDKVVHILGARVRYNPALPAAPTRVTAMEVWDKAAGAWGPVDRMRVYKVVGLTSFVSHSPFTKYFRGDSMVFVSDAEDDYYTCSEDMIHDVMSDYIRHLPSRTLRAANFTSSGYLRADPAATTPMAAMYIHAAISECAATEIYLAAAEECRACPVGAVANSDRTACIPLPPPPPNRTPAIIGGVVGGCVGLGLIVAAAVVYVMRYRGRVRESRPAPEGRVALVFCDVEDSAGLWELMGPAFSDALQVEAAVLRAAARVWRGYEVKQEGDAFFFAFDSAFDACGWCAAVQDALLVARWPAAVLETLDERGLGDPLATGLWRGLRVRMAVHIGRPLPERNPTTGIMDYFGPPVNLTARVQALARGGQILATEAVVVAMADPAAPTPGRNTDAHAPHLVAEDYDDANAGSAKELNLRFEPRGAHSLKGIPVPVGVAAAIPISLAGRVFPLTGVVGAGVVVGAADKLARGTGQRSDSDSASEQHHSEASAPHAARRASASESYPAGIDAAGHLPVVASVDPSSMSSLPPSPAAPPRAGRPPLPPPHLAAALQVHSSSPNGVPAAGSSSPGQAPLPAAHASGRSSAPPVLAAQ